MTIKAEPITLPASGFSTDSDKQTIIDVITEKNRLEGIITGFDTGVSVSWPDEIIDPKSEEFIRTEVMRYFRDENKNLMPDNYPSLFLLREFYKVLLKMKKDATTPRGDEKFCSLVLIANFVGKEIESLDGDEYTLTRQAIQNVKKQFPMGM